MEMAAFPGTPDPGRVSMPMSPMSAASRGRLWIRSGPGQGGCAELAADVTVIGNVPGQCTLVVHDPVLAPRHTEIARLADGFYARDLGTHAGTMCRGQRLGPQPFKLNHGDVLLLGANVALQFEATP
jgi:hypothetical protein